MCHHQNDSLADGYQGLGRARARGRGVSALPPMFVTDPTAQASRFPLNWVALANTAGAGGARGPRRGGDNVSQRHSRAGQQYAALESDGVTARRRQHVHALSPDRWADMSVTQETSQPAMGPCVPPAIGQSPSTGSSARQLATSALNVRSVMCSGAPCPRQPSRSSARQSSSSSSSSSRRPARGGDMALIPSWADPPEVQSKQEKQQRDARAHQPHLLRTSVYPGNQDADANAN